MRAWLLLGALLVALSVAQAARFHLEHSLDGGRTFLPSATVQGNVELGKIDVATSPLTKEHEASLKQLVEDDAFYVVRVGGARASMRAACLASGATGQQLEIVLAGDGSVVGISFQLEGRTAGTCHASAQPALPPSLNVVIKKPTEGPMVMLPEAAANVHSMMFDGDLGAIKAASRPTGGSTSGGAAAGGPTSRPSGEGANGEPVKEKTWWEKNWLLSVGIGMAVFNMVGNVMKQMAEGTPAAPGAAPAAGGAAARPAAAQRSGVKK